MYEAMVSFLEDFGLSLKDWSKTVVDITHELVKPTSWFTKQCIEKLPKHTPEMSFFPPTNVTYLGAFSAAVMTWFVLTGREYSYHGVPTCKSNKENPKSESKQKSTKKSQPDKRKNYSEKLKGDDVKIEKDEVRKNERKDLRSSLENRMAGPSHSKIDADGSENTILDGFGVISGSEGEDEQSLASSSRTEVEKFQYKADLTQPREETNAKNEGTSKNVNSQILESTSARSIRNLSQYTGSSNSGAAKASRSLFSGGEMQSLGGEIIDLNAKLPVVLLKRHPRNMVASYNVYSTTNPMHYSPEVRLPPRRGVDRESEGTIKTVHGRVNSRFKAVKNNTFQIKETRFKSNGINRNN